MFILLILLLMIPAYCQHVSETFTDMSSLSEESLIYYGTDDVIACNSNNYTIIDNSNLYTSAVSKYAPFTTTNVSSCAVGDSVFVYGNSTHVALHAITNGAHLLDFGGQDIMRSSFNVGGSRLVTCDKGTGDVKVFTSNATAGPLVWYQVSVVPGLDGSCVGAGFTTSNDGETLVVIDDTNTLSIWLLDDNADDIEYISSQNITLGGSVGGLVTAWNDGFYVKVGDSDHVEYVFNLTDWVQGDVYQFPNIKLWTVGKNDNALMVVDESNIAKVVHVSGAVVTLNDAGVPTVFNSIAGFDFTSFVVTDGDNDLIHVETSYYTDAPTASPSTSPTASPTTGTPTDAPTGVPTDSPTGEPTSSPTDSPTGSPTTGAPTGSPTTAAPTTAHPTRSPVTTPPTTANPTPAPTESTELTTTTIVLISVAAVLGTVVVWVLAKRTHINYGARAF